MDKFFIFLQPESIEFFFNKILNRFNIVVCNCFNIFNSLSIFFRK